MSDGDAEPDEESGPPPEPGAEPPDRTGSGPRDGSASEGTPAGTERDGAVADAGGPDAPSADEEGTETDRPGGDGPDGTAPASDAEAVAGVAPGEIDVEELTGPVRRLDPRVRYVWVLGSVMGSLVLGGIAGVVGFVLLDRPLLGPAVFLVLFGLGAVLAVLRYRSWSYEVREDSLYLERGVLTQTRTVVPYVRIQHVDASRGPVERALGLATAVVYTAGSRGADVSIPGLTTDRAEDLQERLKRLAIAAEGEDAV